MTYAPALRALLALLLALPTACSTAATPTVAPAIDPVAENMLLLQTASGGWSKHHLGRKVDYTLALGDAEQAALRAADRRDDATLDNKATTSEIAYLARAHRKTGNPAYLAAAGRGVEYLLQAQYANGGWPQYYPDRSSYRHQITLNDDAMVRAIGLLQDIAEGRDDLRFRVQLHAEAAGVIGGLGAAQPRNALRGGIAVRARVLDHLAELVDDRLGRAGRREQRPPGIGIEAGDAGLGDRGHIGQAA